jgi:hypothetical protein
MDTTLNLCKAHHKQKFNYIRKNAVAKPITKHKATHFNPQTICEKMYNALNKVESLKTVTHIRIENQPGLKNPSMKTIASFLFSYFVTKKMENNIIQSIRFVAPSNKLNIPNTDIDKLMNNIKSDHRIYRVIIKLVINHYKLKYNQRNTEENLNTINKYLNDNINNYLKCLLKMSLTNDLIVINNDKLNKDKKKIIDLINKEYEITKNLSIEYVSILINDEQQKFLDKYKKKDDLCDAFLLAYI